MGLRHLVATVVRLSVLRLPTAAFCHRWGLIGARPTARVGTHLYGSEGGPLCPLLSADVHVASDKSAILIWCAMLFAV